MDQAPGWRPRARRARARGGVTLAGVGQLPPGAATALLTATTPATVTRRNGGYGGERQRRTRLRSQHAGLPGQRGRTAAGSYGNGAPSYGTSDGAYRNGDTGYRNGDAGYRQNGRTSARYGEDADSYGGDGFGRRAAYRSGTGLADDEDALLAGGAGGWGAGGQAGQGGPGGGGPYGPGGPGGPGRLVAAAAGVLAARAGTPAASSALTGGRPGRRATS